MPDGLVEACFDTYAHRYLKFITDTSVVPFTDYFSQNIAHTLINFGVEVIRPTMNDLSKQPQLTEKAKEFVLQMRGYAPKSKAMFIDSGGFQILGGQVSLTNMPYLASMYTDFISQMEGIENTYYFYLDVNVINGISPKFSLSSMLDFQTKLEEKTKNNNQKENIYFIYHCNTPIAQKCFIEYADTYHIPERLGSHRYAVGGMVPLNFNNERLQIKTYIYPLFEVINKERKFLESGGEVYYHILGTSGFFEEFLILWCMLYFRLKGWKLHISFDSSTALSLAVRSSLLYYIDPSTKKITQVSAKYRTINHKPNNKQSNQQTNGWYIEQILQMIRSNLLKDSPYYKLDSIKDCFDIDEGKPRFTLGFTLASVIYSYWSYAEIYRIFEKSIMNNPKIIEDSTGETRFDHMISHLEEFSYMKNISQFNKRTYRSLNKSLEYLMAFVDGKVSIDTLRNMCAQDVSENTAKLAFKDDILL